MQELSVYKKNLKPAILEEAMSRFREYGIRAVKMDDIAKNMGISKRTLYEVYSDKEDLLVDVARLAARNCRKVFDAKVGDKIIITAGLPFNITGNTNLLHIYTITE